MSANAGSWKAEAHVDRLKALWGDGYSSGQIAKKLCAEFPGSGYSRNAVIGKIHRLGLSGRGQPSKPRLSPGLGQQNRDRAGAAAVRAARERSAARLLAPEARPDLRVPEVKRAPSTNAGMNFGAKKTPPKPLIVGGAVMEHPEQRPARETVVDLSVAGPNACTLLELANHSCRWPIGDTRSPDFRFCGEPGHRKHDGGATYCGDHHAKAVAPVKPGRPRNGVELARSLRRYA